MRKRITSLFLVLALCLTLLPTAALATENTTEPSTQLTEPTPVPQEPETPGQGENTKTPDQPEEPPQDEEPPAAEEVAPDREVSETADSPHTHPICGETCTDGTHTGNSLTWTDISDLSAITKDGNYCLTNDVTLSGTWTCNDDVTLCLNGYSIKAEHSSPIITVAQGKTFTLTDCNSSKSSKHFKKDDSSGRWVQDDDGTITVNGGAVFHPGNKAGLGVNVPENGTFTMYGGTICGNSGGSGGGVRVFQSGTFNMYGGTICGNIGSYGGGVYVDGTFNMSGNAAITGNTGTYSGGVSVDGTFNMSGDAAITGNGSPSSRGGVHMSGKDANMNVSGNVQIKDNWRGGTLTADKGVYVKGDSGSANNLYLNADKTVTIDDSNGLSSNAHIGVTTENVPAKIATDATKELSYYTNVFTPDVQNQGYMITKDENENALYLSAHQHNWGFTSNGATITATCSQCSASGGSVTINKPAHTTYGDGQSEKATLTGNSWQGLAVNENTITYIKGGTPLEAAPTDAGTYTASITVGEGNKAATASVEYTIQRADPKASDFTFTAPAGLTYDGNAKTATVTEKIGVTDMGDVTVKYFKNGAETGPKDAGDYTVKVSVAEGANYNATTDDLTTDDWKFTIGKATQTITVPTDRTIVKGGIAEDISDWATVAGVTGGSNLGTLSYVLNGQAPEGVSLTGNQLTVQPTCTAAQFTIKVTAEETGNYNKEEQTFTVKVADKNTATVTITGLPDTVTYGQEFTLTASQTGDTTSANKKWTWDYDQEYFKQVGPNANTEAITLQAIKAGTPSKGITATYESGTHKGSATVNAVVEKKKVTVSGITAANKEYNGNNTATVNASGATITGKVDGDKLTITATGTFADADAGENKTVTLTLGTLGGADSANYTLATAGNQTETKANITVRDLTVKPNSGQSKSYGTTPDPVLAYTSTGAVTGETAAFDGALSREAGEDVGQYDITKGSLELKDSGTFKATNYNLVLDTAVVTFEITKGTYGGSAPTKTVNILKNYAGVQTGRLTAADFFTTAPAEAKITAAHPDSTPINMMSLAGEDASGSFTYASKTNITAASDESWTVTISSKNYTNITGTLTFKLVDKTDVSAQITFPNGALTYNGAGQKYEKATISGVSGGTWNYTYAANSGTGASLDSAGLPKTAGTYTVTAKYEDDAHIGIKPATLTVSKATPTGAPTCTKITTSGKTLADAPLAIGTIAPAGGTLAWDMAANTVIAANTAYGWTYTPADTANYKALTGSLTPYAVSSGGGGGGGSSAATPSVSDKAAKELKNAKEGSTVTIDMKGETKLPASVTKEIAGKDVTVELDMGGGIVWSFNGLDVPKGGVRLDLGVKTGTKTIPAKVINALTGETTTIQLQLNHNGSFGMSLKLSVDLGKKHDGLYANLYFYNPKSGELEFQSAGLISGGKASWVFDHASDYAIVIDKESHEPMTFTDVPDTAYYAEAVNWAVAKKITEGIGNKLFGSNDPCTRAQIVTFLWRAAGSPGPKTMSGFSDVPADSYYAKAVAWAVENGITGGTGDGKFSPDATCTRAQAVTFLYRASGAPAVSGNAAFSDVATNAYYEAAVKWAEKNGITGGIGGGLFGSDNNCTRAQIVTFLYRNYQSK